MENHALILVDIQKDFMPDGALPTRGGDQVVPVANRLIEHADLVVATQDWHPPDHGSFASSHEGREPGEVIDLEGTEQILWPDHCVQESDGADFAEDLHIDRVDDIIQKGTNPKIDSYSGFYDNEHRQATGLGDYLEQRNVESIFLVGVATDVCVKFTALDGCELGFDTWVVVDGCRGVGREMGDIDAAYGEMRDAGASLIESEHLADLLS